MSSTSDAAKLIRDLADIVETRLWEMDDRFINERIVCTSCGAESKDRREVEHKPDCEAKHLLDQADAWLKEHDED